jgi:hypothetical protein
MLPGLRHRAVGRRHDQDGTVHMRGAGNHVLDVVGMPRTVDMRIVALFRLILHMRDVDGNASFLFLRCIIDRIKRPEFGESLRGQVFGDRGCQCRLPMINVTDGADVQMRLRPLKFFLSHLQPP